MHLPPPPDSRELLPPLLACLPTAFISPRPPPALLPLLSPLLRQRLSYLSSSNSSRSDGWLPLLSWDAERGAKLPDLVERMHLEPHPVSGEVELDDMRPAKYRRLDQETLHASLEAEQFDILPIYLWCETDEHGGTGAGWKLAELRSLEDQDDGTEWFDSIPEANDAAPVHRAPDPSDQQHQNHGMNGGTNGMRKAATSLGDDDDDYWAAYDRTPGRTPAPKHSPAPLSQQSVSHLSPQDGQRSQAENDYYSRYGAEVQPALDSHDPDEASSELGESTLSGDSLLQPQAQRQSQPPSDRPSSRPTGASLYPASNPQESVPVVSAPRPISPSSSSSSVEKLEARARAISDAQASSSSRASGGDDRAQLAIQQHISTDIKSLFRLARNTGMGRKDFERIVRTELDCLSLMEMEG